MSKQQVSVLVGPGRLSGGGECVGDDSAWTGWGTGL